MSLLISIIALLVGVIGYYCTKKYYQYTDEHTMGNYLIFLSLGMLVVELWYTFVIGYEGWL